MAASRLSCGELAKQSRGLSLLAPHLTILDRSGKVVGQASSTEVLDAVVRGPYEALGPEELHTLFLDPAHVLFHDDLHEHDTLLTAVDVAEWAQAGFRRPNDAILP